MATPYLACNRTAKIVSQRSRPGCSRLHGYYPSSPPDAENISILVQCWTFLRGTSWHNSPSPTSNGRGKTDEVKVYGLMIGYLALALVPPVFAGKVTLVAENTKNKKLHSSKRCKVFIKAEGLNREIQPSYVCQKGQEVCGRITGNLEGLLRKRPDFLPDAYNFSAEPIQAQHAATGG